MAAWPVMGTRSQRTSTVDSKATASLASSDDHGIKILSWGQFKSVFHATLNDKGQVGSILGGIDPKYLNPNGRFGRAFYVAEEPDTALAERKYYGIDATHMIRFEMDVATIKVLDLTKLDVASKYSYVGGPISSDTQALGTKARKAGYNVIRYYSERDHGKINDAIIEDYNIILRPRIVTPVGI